MGYGIGRVPQDVDQASELAAEVEAATKVKSSRTVTLVKCPECGRSYNKRLGMTSSRGTICPSCYDDEE